MIVKIGEEDRQYQTVYDLVQKTQLATSATIQPEGKTAAMIIIANYDYVFCDTTQFLCLEANSHFRFSDGFEILPTAMEEISSCPWLDEG